MQNFHNGYYSQPNHYSYFNQIIFQISLMFSRYHRDYVWCFVIEDKGQDCSMRQVVGLPNNSYKPGFINYKKGALDSQPQVIEFTSCLPMVGWFSPGTPVSSTTKVGRHDITEILLNVGLRHQKSIKIIEDILTLCSYSLYSI